MEQNFFLYLSIHNTQSESRKDIVLDIVQTIHRVRRVGVEITILWIPAHIGVERDELADMYDQEATKGWYSLYELKYSKDEIKSIIKSELKMKWQEMRDRERKGRYLYYRMRRQVGELRKKYKRKKGEDIISRMRFGLTGLNSTLKIIKKHAT